MDRTSTIEPPGRGGATPAELTPRKPEPRLGGPTVEAADDGTDQATAATPTILVVDDSAIARRILQRQLEPTGYEVLEAASGDEAIACARSRALDVILLDVVLGDDDGYQVLQDLRGLDGTGEPSIFLMSAGTGTMRGGTWDDHRVKAQFRQADHALKAGADGYLWKPCDQEYLLSFLNDVIERRQWTAMQQAHLRSVQEHNRMVALELEKARRIQNGFLPARLPALPGFTTAVLFEPAKHVAGDFYDVLPLPGGRIGLVVGDVCDKGLGASMFMALVSSLLRLFSGAATLCGFERYGTPGECDAVSCVAAANEFLAQTHGELGMFATLFFGILTPDTGDLQYVSAGHEPALLLGPDGETRDRLFATGPPVGAIGDAVFERGTARLEPGEALCLYTDGLTDSRMPGGALFAGSRLPSSLEGSLTDAASLATRVRSQLAEHIETNALKDDVTLLVLHREK